MSPTRRVVATIVAVSLISIAVGYTSALFIKSPAQLAAESSPPPRTPLLAKVEEGTIAQSLLAQAVVSLGNKVELSPAASEAADPIITATPVGVGSEVGPGSVLLEIADRPVILLSGDVPLIRDLRRGDEGPDVERLQSSLANFGAPEVDGYFGWDTEEALEALYEAAGYPSPEDGQGNLTALRSELVFAPNGAVGRVVALGGSLGHAATVPAITLTTAPAVVVANLSQLDAARVAPGDAATATGPALEAPLAATVATVGTLTKAADGSFSVPVTLTADGGLPAAAVDSVVQISLNTAADSTTGLLVPLAAVNSNANGSTYVIRVEAGDRERVAVTVAEIGDGTARIEVAPGDLTIGQSVLVGIQ